MFLLVSYVFLSASPFKIVLKLTTNTLDLHHHRQMSLIGVRVSQEFDEETKYPRHFMQVYSGIYTALLWWSKPFRMISS